MRESDSYHLNSGKEKYDHKTMKIQLKPELGLIEFIFKPLS